MFRSFNMASSARAASSTSRHRWEGGEALSRLAPPRPRPGRTVLLAWCLRVGSTCCRSAGSIVARAHRRGRKRQACPLKSIIYRHKLCLPVSTLRSSVRVCCGAASGPGPQRKVWRVTGTHDAHRTEGRSGHEGQRWADSSQALG